MMASTALGVPPPAPQRLSLRDAARARLEARIEQALTEAEHLIARLDRISGDPDYEETAVEDGFAPHDPYWGGGPGCPISDPATGEDCDLEQDDGDGGLCVPYGIDQRRPLVLDEMNVDQRELATVVLKRYMIAPAGAEAFVRP